MIEDIEEVLYSQEALAQRVSELGAAITDHYKQAVDDGEEVVAVCVLRGATIFAADLVRAIDLPVVMDFMAVSSYGSAAKSSGEIAIQKDLVESIEGKHVLIIEDIIDTGLTLAHLVALLETRNPASVHVVALMRKDLPGQPELPLLGEGFPCPDAFVVGYGLDYAEHYRNLPYIGVLKPEIYS